MNKRNTENFEISENEIRTILSEKMDNVMEDIIDILAIENNQIKGHIDLCKTTGDVYCWWDCGNTSSGDIPIKSVIGQSHSHQCDNCSLCEVKIDEMSEKYGIDAENMTIDDLMEIDSYFKGHEFFDDWTHKTVDELRYDCFTDNNYRSSWESIKDDLIDELFIDYYSDVEKLFMELKE